jgi:hypothetical protein
LIAAYIRLAQVVRAHGRPEKGLFLDSPATPTEFELRFGESLDQVLKGRDDDTKARHNGSAGFQVAHELRVDVQLFAQTI